MIRSPFFTLHRDLPREGPGERGDVAWAAEMAALAPDARICEAACGPGADIPALLFAAPEANLIGFDLHQPFVEDAALKAGLLNDGLSEADYATSVSYTHLTLPTTPYV